MAFFVEIGESLARSGAEDGRLVIGISVPARPYAAVLAGIGGVLARAELKDPTEADAESYFEHLSSLPQGTSVTWNNGRSRRPGHLFGVKDTPLGRRLMVKVSTSGGLSEACTVEACLGIQVLEEEINLPQGRGRGRPAGGGVGILSKLLVGSLLFSFVSRTELDCLMVGVGSTLLQEADEELALFDRVSGGYVSAPAAALMRVRGTSAAKDPYRSVIVGTNASKMMDKLASKKPAMVIFDGAQAYLRWRATWPSSPTLLILDRTEAHSLEAAAALDQERILYGSADSALELPSLPTAVELTAYRTKAET